MTEEVSNAVYYEPGTNKQTISKDIEKEETYTSFNAHYLLEHKEKFEQLKKDILLSMAAKKEELKVSHVDFEILETSFKEANLKISNVSDYYETNSFISPDLYTEIVDTSYEDSVKSLEAIETEYLALVDSSYQILLEEQRQAAIEAEAEAARIAAQQSQQQAQAQPQAQQQSQPVGAMQQQSRATPAPVPAAPYVYTARIAGAGDQGLIDACAGAVWWWGMNWLAEHWHCGGSSFPQQPGAIVNIPGSGTYQVIGIVSVVSQSTWNGQFPYGYDLVYQTCLNNNPETSGFIALTRIG